ncbi:MAG TPA: TonB-dependent receptor [Gammaproteobacteria bacterium]|nr:TonB-dependent receptor [Gammaproteobacteria bacterium]
MSAHACAKSKLTLRYSPLAFAVIAAGLIPRGAFGQEAGEQNQLEEIIVTATKQASGQDVSTVPISITAFDGEMIDRIGAKDLSALTAITPGVVLTNTQTFGLSVTNIQIRGVASRTSEPTTGMYLGDTPFTTIGNNTNIGGSVAMPVVFDLERVEVLRGPQGTLFGSTSEGGAIRLIPNAPSLTDTTSYMRLEGNSTAHGGSGYDFGYAMGGPIKEGKLGYRFSTWYREDAGWINHCQPAVRVPGCLYVIEKDANSTTTRASRFALLWEPNDRLTIEPSLQYQSVRNHDPTGYELQPSDPSQHIWNSDHSTDERANDPIATASVKLEWQLENLVATSVTSYINRRYKFHADYTQFQDMAFFGNPYPLTGLPDDYGLGDYGIYQHDLYEEFRVASAKTGSRWNWVAGIFLSDQTQYDYAHVVHPNLPDLVLANFGVPISRVLGSDPYLGKWVAFNDVNTKSQEIALFGNVDYQITDKMRLTVAGRTTSYDQNITSFIAGPFNGGAQFFESDASGSPFTPKVSLSYQATDDTMYYVTAAKGFRIGGVNPQIDNAQPGCQAAKPGFIARGIKFDHQFEPDSLWSYELGVKTRLLDNRLSIDASAYHIDWKDIQNNLGITGCGFSMIFNLGTASANGFDVGLQALVGDHVRLDANVGRTNARYTTTIPGLVTEGEQVSGPGSAVPPWTATVGAEFNFRVGSRDAYAWVQDVYHSFNDGRFGSQTPADAATYNPLLPVNPETRMVNLRVGLRLDKVDASLFVNNATDKHPLLAVGTSNARDLRLIGTTWRPRTVGINATFRY